MTYAEKLKDPRWQKKRLEVLEAANWTCESCESREKTLHVHHRQYFKGHEPWDYAVFHLQALCEDCHKRISDLDKKIREHVALLDEWDKGRLDGYAEGLLISDSHGFECGAEWDDYPVEFKNYEWAKGLGDSLGIPDDEIIRLAQQNDGKLKYSDLLKLHRQFSLKGEGVDELGSAGLGMESRSQSESKVGSDGHR